MTPPIAVPSITMQRLPATNEELWWSIYGLFGMRIPKIAVCPNHSAPFTALADAYFARNPVAVWWASRGLGGKSRTLAALGTTEATLLGCEVTILGGSFAQSKNVHDATKDNWDFFGAPKHLIMRSNNTDTILSNGGHLRTLTASQRSVRGPHPPRLRIDEVDEVELGIMDAALGQPMEQIGAGGFTIPTNTVLSSTWQYPDKTMAEVLKRARGEHPDWAVHAWCFKESSEPTYGWLTPEAIARSKSTVSALAWEREFELQEPSFEGRAIDGDAIERTFDASMGVFVGDKFVFAPAAQNRIYLTSVDWAKQQDQTIITTFDITTTPWTCVAWQKVNQLPWPLLVKHAVDQYRMYGGKFVHDKTGVGIAAEDMLREQLSSYEFSQVTGITMSGGRDRDALYNDYIAAIEHDDIRYPRITYAYEEHKYASVEALFTSKAHAPDSVVAGALAWSTRKARVPIVVPGGFARSSSPWQVD